MMFNLEGWVLLEVGVGMEEEHLSSWNSMCKGIRAGSSVASSVAWGGVGNTWRRRWKEGGAK